MSLAPRPGKGPLCMPRGGAGSHKAPSMCLDVQALVPDTETQVGTETGAQESGEGQFHTSEDEYFLPDHGPQHTQHTPSAHSNPPFCLSPRKEHTSGKGNAGLTGGLHGLQQTWQVSFLHREPCCLVGDKNLYWGQCLSRQVGGSLCAPAGCFPSGNLEFGQKVTLDTATSLVPWPGGRNVSYVTPL